jgi:heme exporter protein D
MLFLELAIAVGIIVLAVRILPGVFERRAEAKRLSEDRRARLEAARSAQDVVESLMLERELAREVHRKLGAALAEEDRKN